MRALIIEKSILIRCLLDRYNEGQTDLATLHPSHLSRDETLVKEVEKEVFTNVRSVWEKRHGPGFGHIDEPNDMLASAKLEHGGARRRRAAQLPSLVDRAVGAARDHPAIKGETRRHSKIASPLGRGDLSQLPLRIGLR
jgi:hypothetical protein